MLACSKKPRGNSTNDQSRSCRGRHEPLAVMKAQLTATPENPRNITAISYWGGLSIGRQLWRGVANIAVLPKACCTIVLHFYSCIYLLEMVGLQSAFFHCATNALLWPRVQIGFWWMPEARAFTWDFAFFKHKNLCFYVFVQWLHHIYSYFVINVLVECLHHIIRALLQNVSTFLDSKQT